MFYYDIAQESYFFQVLQSKSISLVDGRNVVLVDDFDVEKMSLKARDDLLVNSLIIMHYFDSKFQIAPGVTSTSAGEQCVAL